MIIRFSSIGDIVLTTPVIRCVKKQLGAEVHFLTKKSYASIVVDNPYLEKVFAIQKKVSEVLPQLKKEGYDFIVDLHNNLRSNSLRPQLKVSGKAFNKLNLQKWLMVNFKWNRLPPVHIVDRYLETVRSLGVVNDYNGLDYFIPEKDKVILPATFIPHQPNTYLAFGIGAAHQTKRMTTEKIIRICQQLKRPVVLLGGPGEAEEGTRIAKAGGSHVLNTCGKLNLNQSASVVRQSVGVITHDTGIMHIAAAFQKRIVSVWGNTIPEFGMFPYYPKGITNNTTIQVKGLSCRPCSKIGFAQCPKGHFNCMERIDETAIIKAVEQWT